MRGVSSGDNGNHSGPLPSVGVYLDEQPITTIQGALDIHIYDIERVEALAGPQGTLYGASSEAGTIRIITNKPDLTGFKAGYSLQGNYVDHGDRAGYVAEGFVNLPLSSTAAVRLVGWAEHAAATSTTSSANRTFPQFEHHQSTTVLIPTPRSDFNDVTIYGGRGALKIDLNDNWTVTPSFMGQSTRPTASRRRPGARATFNLEHFSPDNVGPVVAGALTVEGKISNFDITYAGAYLNRHDDAHRLHRLHAAVRQARSRPIPRRSSTTPAITSIRADTSWVRTSTASSARSCGCSPEGPAPALHRRRLLRAPGALHHAELPHRRTADLDSVTGWPQTWWLTDQVRVDRDYAVFGELSFDITPKLTGTVGYRIFRYDNSLDGFFGFGLNNPLGCGKRTDSQAGVSDLRASRILGAPCLTSPRGKSDSATRRSSTSPTSSMPTSWCTPRTRRASARVASTALGRPAALPAGLPHELRDRVQDELAENHLRFNGAFF